MAATILIVEDDELLAQSLALCFKRQGWQAAVVPTVSKAIAELQRRPYDLAVVDRSLRDGDGLKVVEYADQERYPMRTMVLSGTALTEHRIRGFKAGASDYVAKPFSYQEIQLRVHALLLSDKRSDRTHLAYRNIRLYQETGELWISTRRKHIRPKESAILACLIRHRRQTVTRDMLVSHIWGDPDKAPDFASIDVYVRRVRMIIRDSQAELRTIRSFGYRLE